MHSLKRRDTVAAVLMLLPFMLFFALFVLYPTGVNLYLSFTDYNLASSTWTGLRNFERLLRDPTFGRACLNTGVTVTSVSGMVKEKVPSLFFVTSVSGGKKP